MAENWQEAGFGLYVHWPFCDSKCPYCDFNSHVAGRVDQNRWIAAYVSEINRLTDIYPDRTLSSVYFGGGTPSLMDPATVSAVLNKAAASWRFAPDIEITLEANPGSVEAARFRGYAQAGVNRLSIGVQALNDADLRVLGRLHDTADALAALDIARASVARVSFDLIYARQNQSLADWRRELERALSFEPDHLSLYQLTIEDGTAFADRFRRGRLKGLPDEDHAAEMFLLTQETCAAAGLPAYEVSNHAREGAEGRHNLIYWRQGDYAGIGPGAHGRLSRDGRRVATETLLGPDDWLSAVETRGSGELRSALVAPEDAAIEYLMMSLRLAEGTDLARYRQLGGADLDAAGFDAVNGLVSVEGNRLRLTPEGRPLLNAVLRSVLPAD